MCAKSIIRYTEGMERFLIPPGEIDEILRPDRLFGNGNPVEIEIGTGKGRFILAESLRRPDTNFLGIERSLKWIRVALERAARNPRPNCLFLCLDADFTVKLLLPPRSIAAYHVYFPDPWHKDRHKKRRLFNPRFIEKAAETLVPAGKLRLRTDHQEYFEDAFARISESGAFDLLERDVSMETYRDFEEAGETDTHYEIKFRQEARPIYSAVFASRPG